MQLPPQLQNLLDQAGLSALLSELSVEHLLVLFMLGVSLLLVAVAIERAWLLLQLRRSIAAAAAVVDAARTQGTAAAGQAAGSLSGPAAPVFTVGLSRATGQVRGNAARSMAREQRRLAGALKARMWILGTAGALMPFVGLFGTVIGVMAAFQAIGESGQGGFAIVSVGISQALVATAVGIAVALEGVVLFNVLQNVGAKLGRELGLMVDELLELVEAEAQAGPPVAPALATPSVQPDEAVEPASPQSEQGGPDAGRPGQ